MHYQEITELYIRRSDIATTPMPTPRYQTIASLRNDFIKRTTLKKRNAGHALGLIFSVGISRIFAL